MKNENKKNRQMNDYRQRTYFEAQRKGRENFFLSPQVIDLLQYYFHSTMFIGKEERVARNDLLSQNSLLYHKKEVHMWNSSNLKKKKWSGSGLKIDVVWRLLTLCNYYTWKSLLLMNMMKVVRL